MNGIDRELCEEMADLWQSRGGDAEGLCYCWMAIHEILKGREEAIDEILRNRVKEDEHG